MAEEQENPVEPLFTMGNITIIIAEDEKNLLAYRKTGALNTLVAAFPLGENAVGVSVAALFAGFMADIFPEGELTVELFDAAALKLGGEDIEAKALAEINRLKLFGQDVEIKH